MYQTFAELFEDLMADFHPDQIRQRSVDGQTYQYVTPRTVMNRLDKVVGPENWEDDYRVSDTGAVICELTLNLRCVSQHPWSSVAAVS